MKFLKFLYKLVRRGVLEFIDDDGLTLAAALAFYSALSLAPLLVILIWASGFMGPDMQAGLVAELVKLIGEEGGQAVSVIVDNARDHPDMRSIAGLLSIAVLIFSATTAFGQVQHSLNVIWDVESKPGFGVMVWCRKRLLSLGLVVTVGFLLLVSLALSAGLSFALTFLSERLPGTDFLWQFVNLATSLIVFTLLFAAMFKILPDVRIRYAQVWGGALATSLLFGLGKLVIGLYLGRSSIGSAYGAAGSLLVLLVWMYYSAIILFFGAELTQVYTRMCGKWIEPERHARYKGRKKHGEELSTASPS